MARPKRGFGSNVLPATYDGRIKLYVAVFDSLRNAILGGEVARGERLLSTRAMAEKLGVSRNTVRVAYELLVSEGAVTVSPKSGYFVAIDPPLADDGRAGSQESVVSWTEHRQRQLSKRGKLYSTLKTYGSAKAIAFDGFLPSSELFPAKDWLKVVSTYWSSEDPTFSGYGQPGGYLRLREIIAHSVVRRRGIECRPEQIIIVSGDAIGITLVSRLLLDRGDSVWVEEPGHNSINSLFLGADLCVAPVPIDDEGLIVSAGRSIAPKAKMIHVTPSHHYPCATNMPLSRRFELLEWADQANAWILENDYDSEYIYRGQPLPALKNLDRSERVIYLGSFIKSLSPNVNVAYLVVPQRLVPSFETAQFASRSISHALQEILARFIEQGFYQRHINRTKPIYRRRRDALLAAIEANAPDVLQANSVESGFSLVANVVNGASSDQISVDVKRYGLIAHSLRSYLHNPENPSLIIPEALVLGFTCVSEENMDSHIRTLAQVIREAA